MLKLSPDLAKRIVENKIEEKFVVKELADALQVSTRYVYEMRACGFEMQGIKRNGQTSTVQKAVDWIKENDFRMIHGVGRVTKGAKIEV